MPIRRPEGLRCLTLLLAIVLTAPAAGRTMQAPDYAALYEQGVAWETFIENVRGRRDTWRANVAMATVPADMAARARALPHTWRILAVTLDRCSDSAASLPYIAALAAAAPNRLSLRIVDPDTGRAVMEAHRTPDGRTATPTLIFIRDDGETRAWIERPAALVAWIAEQQQDAGFDLLEGKTGWYEKDEGRSTIADVLALLET